MAEHIQDRAQFNIIRYANCWEDADVLVEALQGEPGKCFLSVASAGDNSFSLLSSGASVVAADLSPTQLACVELRREAFRNLDHAGLLSFLGVTPSIDRLETYDTISLGLSKGAKRFWDSNREALKTGFIHQGKFEKYFRKFRTRVLPLVHSRRRIEELLVARDHLGRVEFYQKKWNNWRWRLLFRIFFSRFVMGRLGRDPEFFRYVEGSVADRILDRTEHALTELETHNNPYLVYILHGNFLVNSSAGERLVLPHYLRAENFESIKSNLDNMTLFQGSIEQASKELGTDGFDGFNLSDIFEYLDDELCRNIYGTLLRHARDRARFVYWNMLVPRRRPTEMEKLVIEHRKLADQLWQRDKAWFYSALVVEEKAN